MQTKRQRKGCLHRVRESSEFYSLRLSCSWGTRSLHRVGCGVPTSPFSGKDLERKSRSLSPYIIPSIRIRQSCLPTITTRCSHDDRGCLLWHTLLLFESSDPIHSRVRFTI